MRNKKPSSLDYSELLHELALKNWRRAMTRGNPERASLAVEPLCSAEDRFWRWQGLVLRAQSQLFAGRAADAVTLLGDARREANDPNLSTVVLLYQAHALLEAGSSKTALGNLETARAEQRSAPLESQYRYWSALALCRAGKASSVNDKMQGFEPGPMSWLRALPEHVRGEVALSEGEPARARAHLEKAVQILCDERAPASAPVVPIRFALARIYQQVDDRDQAARALGAIASDEEAQLEWPVPGTRSYFELARLLASDGDEQQATAAYRTFVDRWRDGDLDREKIEEARHWLEARE